MAIKKIVKIWEDGKIIEENIKFLKKPTKKVRFPLTDHIHQIIKDLIDTYKTIYDEVKKDFSAQALATQGVDITELRDIMSVAEINKAVQRIINERSVRIETGRWSTDDNFDFVAVVPVTVLDKVNKILVSGQGISKGGKGEWTPDTDTIKSLYKEFLEMEAPALTGKYKDNKEFNSLNSVQSEIETEGKMKDKFLAFVSDKVGVSVPPDDPDTPEIESITKAPKVLADEELQIKMAKESGAIGDSVIKLDKEGKVIPQTEGKYGTDKTRITLDPDNKGFKQGGIFIPWEKIEKLNQVDKLPNLLKLRYEAWKSEQ